MSERDPRVTAYVERSGDFARPILEHLRGVVHAAVPDVQETMKWSFPHFMYKGMLCSMAAFKHHCAFGFWKSKLVLEDDGSDAAMGQFGRITAVRDLPSRRELIRLVRKAAALNDAGIAVARAPRRPARTGVSVPRELKAALDANPAARATFERFSPSHRREYAEWIAEAKGEETRKRRLARTVEWLKAGKPRNWKYIRE
jgi:uncharacterized protein YdeI (YjbR/CyaY-like superfamily)